MADYGASLNSQEDIALHTYTAGSLSPMMANAPFSSGAPSLLEDLKGPDNGMQQLNSGFNSLSFSSTMSNGVIQKPSMAPNNMDRSFGNFVPQDNNFVPQDNNFAPQDNFVPTQVGGSPFYPSSPMSPVFHQQNKPQLVTRHQSLGDEMIQGIAPRNNNFAASPVIHSKRTFSPITNTPISLDGRFNQFSSAGNSNQQHDPLASFLPPPPNLDTSDASNQIGRLDNNNTGLFLSENESNLQSQSPFASPLKSHGNLLNDASLNMNRERSFSLPGTYRQPSFGAKSPPAVNAPSSQILYEDQPSSWNEGSGFTAPRFGQDLASSPSNYDRFNSRPPRHGGTRDAQALLSPRIEMRHAASDGNFNFLNPMPMPGHMSPNPNHGRFQGHIGQAVIGSPSFDSCVQGQGGQMYDRRSFGSMDALNSNNNFQHYHMPQSSCPMPMPPPSPMQPMPPPSPMQPGFVNSGNMQQDNYFAQSPATPGLQRHNSTGSQHNSMGSQHFLVNERGEIVGHASPVVTHNTLEGFAPQGKPRNNFPPTRPQRANSYGGPLPFNQIQPQQAPPLNFNPISFHSDGLNMNPSMDHPANSVGSIGDGRMQHHRNHTEPIPLLMNHNSGGSILPRHTVPGPSERFEQVLAGENINIEGIDAAGEAIRCSNGVGAVEEKAPTQSYAAKLMMPCPKPVLDHTNGRVTAGASLGKSGPRMIYNIKFKRSQKNFVLGQRITREIKIGCYVKVEADRGEDMGIVMGIIPIDKFLASNRHRSMTEDSAASGELPAPPQITNIGDMKRIMRVATHDEITLLEVKRDEEEELLKICSTKVRQRGLPMSVVDAEYQYDRNKLTFFFQAEGRIDFRELVRDLFSMYKTRIWMEQIDKNGNVDGAEGNLANE